MSLMRLSKGCIALLAAGLLFLPIIASAQIPTIVPCDGVNCGVCDIAELAQNVLNAGIYIAIFLAAVLFAWAGWQYVTAGGDTGKSSSARKTLTNTLIGIIIILAGWLIVDTLMKQLVREDSRFGPWNEICRG